MATAAAASAAAATAASSSFYSSSSSSFSYSSSVSTSLLTHSSFILGSSKNIGIKDWGASLIHFTHSFSSFVCMPLCVLCQALCCVPSCTVVFSYCSVILIVHAHSKHNIFKYPHRKWNERTNETKGHIVPAAGMLSSMARLWISLHCFGTPAGTRWHSLVRVRLSERASWVREGERERAHNLNMYKYNEFSPIHNIKPI